MVALETPPSLLSGPFRYADARAAGLSRRGLQRVLDEGVVRRVLRDVYAAVDLPDTVGLRMTSAALVVPPHAVIVDRTAAWIWGCDLRAPGERYADPPLDLFVPPGHKRVTRPQARGGERTLRRDDVTHALGLRVTTPVRTALDLGRLQPRYEALAAMDALARAQGVGADQLVAHLPRFRGYRGVVQLRALVPLVDGRAESSGESFTRLAISDAGLPVPRPQLWVPGPAGRCYRLDLAYEGPRVCVEYDGEEFHSSDERRRADDERRAWLRGHGWVVIVVDRHSFRGAALDGWLHELRRALQERA